MQYIAIDTETFLISDEEPIPRLVCMSFYYKSPRNETYFNDVVKEEKSILNYLTTWLNDEKITLLAHNASFDFTVFCRAFPDLLELINKKYKAGLIICTRLQEQLLQLKNGDYGLPSSLAFCVEKYLGLDINASKGEDSWRMNYWILADVPLTSWAKDAIDYAKADAKYCYEVFIKQNSNIEDVKKQGYCDFLCTIMTKLQGLQIDQEFSH